MSRNVLAYVFAILVFGAGIFAIIQSGKRLEVTGARPAISVSGTETKADARTIPGGNAEGVAVRVARGLRENLRASLSLLLVQLILIVLLARVFGALFARLGQPAVIGEMIAGIVLGPSLVGALFPGVFEFIFPATSLGVLRMLSQVGVILFMFVVGMDVDAKHLRNRANTAIIVSHVGIVFPYFLGVLFSFFMYRSLAPARASFPAFALFIGIAMSITAFPVLARIIEERGLGRSTLGATAIACAAIDDITAWSILAFVVTVVKADGVATSVTTLFLALAFVAVTLWVVKPLLNKLVAARPEWVAASTKGSLVGVLVLVFASALFTEVIGIHSFFGAFLAGVAMPAHPEFRSRLKDRLESFSSAFLLPLFFAFTGLRSQIGLLNDWESWGICAALILVATLGKLGGCLLAARWTGMSWPDSFALGVLMNTRGLVELVVLNIGFDLGILSPRVFTMMIIMALVTTFMTGPLLSFGNWFRYRNPALANESPIP